MKKSILLISLCFMAFVSFSQIQNVFEISKDENKFVYQDKFIKLFMGDEIFIRVTSSNDTLKNFEIVTDNEDKENTISISFTIEKYKGEKISVLKVKNPFEKELHYKALISTLQRPNYEETSIVPVYPEISSQEMWPYKIESIILHDFQLKQNP